MIRSLLNDVRVRFLIAGGSAAALNWLIRIPLGFVMPYGASVVVALAIGMTYGFIIYRGWAFGSSGRSLLAEIRDFIVVNLVGALVTIIVSVAVQPLLSATGLPLTIAETLAHGLGIAMGAVLNYFGHKQITFRA